MTERVGLQGVFDLSQFSGNVNVYLNGVAKIKGETASAATSISRSGQGINVFSQIATGAFRAIGEQAAFWLGRAAREAFGFINTSITSASNLAESTSKVNVVFGAAAKSVLEFGATAATSIGQSNQQALEAAGTYGNLLTSIGFTREAAAGMSIEMVKLASDLASFNNASIEETLLAIRSALTGEFEPMKRFGTALSQDAVSAKALALGLVDSTEALTPAIKAQAAYALILEQTTNAQGDFARTADGLANSQRVVAAQFENLRAKTGNIFQPLAASFVQFKGNFLSEIGTLVDDATPLLNQIIGVASDTFTEISGNALDWGRNVTLQFAQGMIDGIGFVLEALTSIANVVTSWLMPGSPPRLLPDLDKWGAEAFGVYMQGWTKGDFSAFNDISRTIESFLKSGIDSSDKGAQSNLIATLLGSRAAITQAINDVREFGSVSQASLRQIFDAVSVSSPELEAYIATMLNLEGINQQVAEAQGELTEAQKAYDEAVKASQKEIDAITNAEEDLADQVAISQLRLIENDPNATALEKQRARLKIQELMAKKQQRDTLAEKKDAVDAAQTKLDGLQEQQALLASQADAQKALLDVMGQQNQLLAERNKLEAGSGGGGGGGGAKGGGKGGGLGALLGGAGLGDALGIEDMKEQLLGGLDSLLQPLQSKLTAFQTAFSTAWTAITNTLAPASQAWNDAVRSTQTTFGNLIAAITEKSPLAQAAIGFLGGIFTQTLGTNLPVIITNFSATVNLVLTNLATFWRTWGDEIIMATTFIVGALIAGIGGGISLISALLLAFTTFSSGIWTAFGQLLQGDWQGAWDTILTTVDSVLDIIADGLIAFFDSALALVDMDLNEFFDIWDGVFDLIDILVKEVFGRVEDITADVLQKFRDTGDYLEKTFGPTFDELGKTVGELATTIGGFVSGALTDLSGIWTGINQGIQDAIKWITDLATKLATIALPDWMTPGSPTPWENGLRGVIKAVNTLSKTTLPNLAMSLTGPRMQTASHMLAPMAPVYNQSSTSNVNHRNYNLSVNTRDTVQTVEHNFYHMAAKYGGG